MQYADEVNTNNVVVESKELELVFFGRLEVRKGLSLFADALDVLAQSTSPNVKNLKVSFLGRTTSIGNLCMW